MILCFPHWQFAVNIFLIMMQRYRDSLKVKFWHTLLAAIIYFTIFKLWNSISNLIINSFNIVYSIIFIILIKIDQYLVRAVLSVLDAHLFNCRPLVHRCLLVRFPKNDILLGCINRLYQFHLWLHISGYA